MHPTRPQPVSAPPAPRPLTPRTLRVPPGFMAAVRRLVGQEMARTGRRITAGEVLLALVERALAEGEREAAS